MLLGTLGISLLGNLLAVKGVVRAGSGNKKRKGIVRAGYGYLHPLFCKKNRIFNVAFNRLTNLEIQKYYQNEPRFNGVFSNDLPKKIKDGAYVINLDEYADVGTHWIALFCNRN